MSSSKPTFAASRGSDRRTEREAARRIATVWLPAPALQLAARERPELKRQPVVLASSHEGSARVTACSRRARAHGIFEGQTLAQARATCAALVVVEPDEEALLALRREVREAISTVAHGAEWGGGGCHLVDASGLSRLHGSERSLLVRLWQAVASRRLVARVGCAGTRLTATLAARFGRGFRVVAPGEEADFLAPLPLSSLPVPKDVRDRLHLLGVRTLGAFANLPPDGVAARFGSEVSRWQQLARGRDPRPLALDKGRDLPHAARDLDEPVLGLEPVTFLLKGLAEELAEELARRGTGAAVLEMSLVFDRPADTTGDGRTPPPDVRRVRPSRALVASRSILDLCRLELEARPVAGAIRSLALVAREEENVSFSTRDLFGGSADPAALAQAIDRLRTLLGPDRVSTPAPRLAWRREARKSWAAFGLGARSARERAKLTDDLDPGGLIDHCDGLWTDSCPAEKLLPRPVPTSVRLPGPRQEGNDDRGDEEAGKTRRGEERPGRLVVPPAAGVLGERPREVEIVEALGPWRVSGEWWDGGHDVERDEYLLIARDGGLHRVFFDRRRREWLLAGCID